MFISPFKFYIFFTSFTIQQVSRGHGIYRILPNTRASPNRRAPPPKFFDHIPEDSSPKIYMTT